MSKADEMFEKLGYELEDELDEYKKSSINILDPKREYMKLLEFKPSLYKKYNLRINTKYSDVMPSIFWSALSRGFKTIEFKDLNKAILYEMEE